MRCIPVLLLVLASACVHQQEAASYTPALTPQGAAALAVLSGVDLTRGPVVVVTGRRIPHLYQDVSVLADTVWLWESDTLYGGERRLTVLPDSYYVLLDLREVGNLGGPSQTFQALVKSCSGFPCHSDYRVHVRGDGSRFVADTVYATAIE